VNVLAIELTSPEGEVGGNNHSLAQALASAIPATNLNNA
jgi:hypothetical protein